jgi:hypothetical protein
MRGQHNLRETGTGSKRDHRPFPRQVRHHQPGLRLDRSTTEWHAAAEAGVSQALAEGFAYCFFGGPEVEEGDQVVGLLGHPLEFCGVEPAVGEGGHLARVDVFDVHAERTRDRRGNHYEITAVADADRQPVDVRLPVAGVMERRRADQRAREVEQQGVGRGARLGAGRRHPDMYRITHRKKVTR